MDQRTRVEIRHLSKTYGEGDDAYKAVADASFCIPEGEFVALLGPSGCGKSTILNMIAGLIPATSGEIFIDGALFKSGQVLRSVGYVFQRDTVFPWLTVEQNIEYGLKISGMAEDARKERVAKMISLARLKGFERAYPKSLSGGMRQRVALMRTLVMRPQILLMDEPFGALDTHTKLEMHELLLEIWEQERQTVLFVTHDLSEAITLADRIILMSARPGRLKEDFVVSLPRPRDAIKLKEDQHYGALFGRIWHSLGEEFSAAKRGD